MKIIMVIALVFYSYSASAQNEEFPQFNEDEFNQYIEGRILSEFLEKREISSGDREQVLEGLNADNPKVKAMKRYEAGEFEAYHENINDVFDEIKTEMGKEVKPVDDVEISNEQKQQLNRYGFTDSEASGLAASLNSDSASSLLTNDKLNGKSKKTQAYIEENGAEYVGNAAIRFNNIQNLLSSQNQGSDKLVQSQLDSYSAYVNSSVNNIITRLRAKRQVEGVDFSREELAKGVLAKAGGDYSEVLEVNNGKVIPKTIQQRMGR